MTRLLALAVTFAILAVAPAQGQITIDLGDHVLRPNEAGQFIPIRISTAGNDEIVSADLFLQIEGGTGPRPKFNIISDIEGGDPTITSGAIFQGTGFVFDGQSLTAGESPKTGLPPEVHDQLAFFSIENNSGNTNVSADGILASLEVDTTGVFDGSFNLIDVRNFSTFTAFDPNAPAGEPDPFFTVSKTETGTGSITIAAIPEPGSAIALAGVTLAIFARRRRR